MATNKKTDLLAKLEAGRAQAQKIAAPAAVAPAATWPHNQPVVVAAPAAVGQVQLNIRISPSARQKLHEAARVKRMSIAKLIEAYAEKL